MRQGSSHSVVPRSPHPNVAGIPDTPGSQRTSAASSETSCGAMSENSELQSAPILQRQESLDLQSAPGLERRLSSREPLGLPEGFLRACASRWPRCSGGRMLQRAAGSQAYEQLVGGEISAEDEEQIRIDVERSSVDDLEELYPPALTDNALCEALARLLHAWCCRHPNGYCQGMNFVGMVLVRDRALELSVCSRQPAPIHAALRCAGPCTLALPPSRPTATRVPSCGGGLAPRRRS